MNEETLWTANVNTLDFVVSPVKWFFTFITLGLYPIIAIISRLSKRYKLTNQRLILTKGILSKKQDDIELFRIVDTKVSQSITDRLVGIGDITVTSTDNGTFVIRRVGRAQSKREVMRIAVNSARKETGVRTIIE